MVEKSFEQIFEIEVDCWCYGIAHTTEKVDQRVLHQVIKAFAPVLREAIQNHYAFDILEIAKRLVTSGHCKILEKEIAFHLLSSLPTPQELSKEQDQVLREIVTQVENAYGGAFKRLEKKWAATSKCDFSELSLAPTLQVGFYGDLTCPGKVGRGGD